MAQPYKRSLIPVVNRRFQYKYTAIIIGIAGVVSAVLGALLLNSYWEMSRIIDLAMESPEISNKVDIDQALRVFHISIAFLVIEVLALGVMGLLITHRLCGPEFVTHRQLATLLGGKYPRARPLRAGDEFVSSFETLTMVIESLKNRDMDEAEELTRVIAAARHAGMADSDIAALQQLVDERRARLRGDGNDHSPCGLDAPVAQRSP